MAVGTYNLPICDGCKLPWLPVGWTQDSDPRNLPKGAKPLRCGKCKSAGWDKLHNAESRKDATDTAVNPLDPTKTVELPRNVDLNEALEAAEVPRGTRSAHKARCRHRMTDCPLCKPEAA